MIYNLDLSYFVMLITENLHNNTCHIQRVSLTCPPGESIAVVGPSGCGKSTLLNMLGLISKPLSGNYQLYGTNLLTLSHNERAWYRAHRISTVFQQHHLIPSFTVEENIKLALWYHADSYLPDECDSLLEKLEIDHLKTHTTDILSLGERQRVAIARALIKKPKLLLADEPTASLDSQQSTKAIALMKLMCHEHNTILIMATHNNQAIEACHHTYSWSS